ncbi:MAG: amino acid ABC transporter permease [Ruminococcaceae bacterium]|nr:amino acid ABC transporter permease [Oscillospiraceae bacterium]
MGTATLLSVTENLFVNGFLMTMKLFGMTLLFAIPLGLIISFGLISKFKPLRLVVNFLVWVIRGTPLMLQLIVVYYGPGLIWGGELLERFNAVLIAFVINYACYFAVIYKGGIESISQGQYEAGQVLGMTKAQIFFKVILLQVIKRILAPMSNEIITLVKDTSLARIIAVYELIFVAQDYIKTDGIIWPLFYTAVFYLLFCGLLTLLFNFFEKKLDYFKS